MGTPLRLAGGLAPSSDQNQETRLDEDIFGRFEFSVSNDFALNDLNQGSATNLLLNTSEELHMRNRTVLYVAFSALVMNCENQDLI